MMTEMESAETPGALRGHMDRYITGYDYFEELISIIDIKDGYTRQHSDAVRDLSVATARALGIDSEAALSLLGMAAWLHDIGKIVIPKEVLCKPGPLTSHEKSVMRQHPYIGSEIVKLDRQYGPRVSPIVLYHHEWFDGTGIYRLKDGEIPRFSRIIHAADSYEAMAADRPYRERRDEQFIKDEFIDGTGSQFDPLIVEAFFHIMDW